MDKIISLRTGVWYGDRQIDLPIPSNWDVKIQWPDTPPPLSTEKLKEILDHPAGNATLNTICRGKSRPLIIVDDLNRPSPASEIMPLVLNAISSLGIPLEAVKILMATGTHGQPGADAILKKVGNSAATCQLLVHDCFKRTIKIGVTSTGTPVFVNRAILESDMVMGISGIYPNHSAGFGGGTKIALGVLGIQTIYHLHFGHKAAGWGNFVQNKDFRNELDEIARMIGMAFNISLIIDANRQIIQMYCGDAFEYFPHAVDEYQRIFSTPTPGDADVVISNAYPNDCSLTFARMKGFVPLNQSRPTATRISIAACSEGLGLHNIWPFVNVPPFHRLKHILRVLSVLTFKEMLAKGIRLVKRVLSILHQKSSPRITHDLGMRDQINPVWLYQTGDIKIDLPASVPGIHITPNWEKILEAVRHEQTKPGRLKVLVYPCAFLQLLNK